MMEYFTPNNITMILVILLTIEKVLRIVAPLTATKADDTVVALFDSGRDFVRKYGGAAWAIVEGLEKSGVLKKENKLGMFLMRLEEAYHAVEGQILSGSAKEEAKLIAAGLSAAAKLPVTGNPSIAPGSN